MAAHESVFRTLWRVTGGAFYNRDMSPDDEDVPLIPAAYVPAEYDPLRASQLTSQPVTSPRTAERSNWRAWLMVGALLWAVGIAGWLVFFVQGCEPEGDGKAPAVKRK
jgi:hypothetical protein